MAEQLETRVLRHPDPLIEWLKQHVLGKKYANICEYIYDGGMLNGITYSRNLFRLSIHLRGGYELAYRVSNAIVFTTTIEDPNSIPELLKALEVHPISLAKQRLKLDEYYLCIIDQLLWDHRGSDEMGVAIKLLDDSELKRMLEVLSQYYNPSETSMIEQYLTLIHSKGIEEARKILTPQSRLFRCVAGVVSPASNVDP